MTDYQNTLNATILSGASLSDTICLKGYCLMGLQMPAVWVTTLSS